MNTVASTGRIALLTLAVLVAVSATVACTSAAPEPNTSAPIVVAAGDIADCYSAGDEATARLLGNIEGTVLTLSDNAYEDGTPQEFANCYAPSWGRYKDRAKPSPGNHEYHSRGAEGYFDYFGEAAGDPDKGYYSYDLGAWHIVALNSNRDFVGGCYTGDPQVRWLKADLADNRSRCTLAYFHHPLFGSGEYGPGVTEVKPLWEILYAAGGDVVLNGHDHNYQRFALQNPDGEASAERGIREFVVGTGGRSHYPIVAPVANSEAHNDDAYGVLKLTLRPQGYDWQFVPGEGETFTDTGSAQCH
jgi:hypothetical protein